MSRLLERRADLHQQMGNFRLALQDGDSMCQLKPLWPKVKENTGVQADMVAGPLPTPHSSMRID